jgi:hypothetical protein
MSMAAPAMVTVSSVNRPERPAGAMGRVLATPPTYPPSA